MKVSKQVFGAIMGAAIGFVMSIFMSFFLLLANAGFIEGFFFIWLKSFVLGFAISIPVGLVTAPLVERFLRGMLHVQD